MVYLFICGKSLRCLPEGENGLGKRLILRGGNPIVVIRHFLLTNS